MKCEKCGNEDLHVVSEYVELPKKKEYFITVILLFLIYPTLFFGVIIFCRAMCSSTVSVESVSFFTVAFILLGVCLFLFLIYTFIKIFQPYEHATRLRFVCLKCGHSTILPIEVKENEPINVDNSDSAE